MTNLKEIEQIAEKFENSVEILSKEIKRIQSKKCNLAKKKFKSGYEQEMTEVVKYEQVLKEARRLISPKKKSVTEYEQSDIDLIDDYDELTKAIKSIQSKKTNSQYLTENRFDNDEYRNAEKIEKMLIARRAELKPVDDQFIRKTELQAVIETIESSGKVSQDRIIEMLKELL